MILLSERTITLKGGILIPIEDFITATLNISKDDIQIFETVVNNQEINYYLTLKIKPQECPHCGGKMYSNGVKLKKIKHPTLREYDGYIYWRARRYKCSNCQHTTMENNPFSLPGFTISFSVAQRIMNELRNLNYTYNDIAKRNCVSVTTVQSYFDSWVNIPRLHLPEWIGIDEIHSDMAKYGSAYLCILADCTGRSVFEILSSRSKHILGKYFEAIPLNERNKVLYVTIDMWEPYKDIATKYFKKCILAVDPFHVIKHLSECFTRIRLNIMRQVNQDSTTYYLLKKWHYLLEKDYDLDNEPLYNSKLKRKCNHRDIYEMLLSINEDFTCAYQLKETYRRFNINATEHNAEDWLNKLIESFTTAKIAEYQEFTNLLIHWKPEIINSFKKPYDTYRLSNAFTENANGQIKGYLDISNGNANFERFRKKIIYAFNDNIFYSISQSLKSAKRDFPSRGPYNK